MEIYTWNALQGNSNLVQCMVANNSKEEAGDSLKGYGKVLVL